MSADQCFQTYFLCYFVTTILYFFTTIILYYFIITILYCFITTILYFSSLLEWVVFTISILQKFFISLLCLNELLILFQYYNNPLFLYSVWTSADQYLQTYFLLYSNGRREGEEQWRRKQGKKWERKEGASSIRTQVNIKKQVFYLWK